MKSKKRKGQPLNRQEAVDGLAEVRSLQVDMRQVQKLLGDLGPLLQTIAGMSGRIDKLEEITGSLAVEVVALKRRG